VTTTPSTDSVHQQQLDFDVTFPTSGIYSIAGRAVPVVILGLAPRNELRIVDANGSFRTVAEHRVRLLKRLSA
jgi:hypothetical protein